MTVENSSAAYDDARAALFVRSQAMPEDAQEVQGIEFNDFAGRSMTVEELVHGMSRIGFQASSVGQAVNIINSMVGSHRSLR